ncbi:RNA-binding S4 domain-containing protein [Corynebacterium lizhenjunii]|uniref:RNA-binding S4 domain-containing protein n=1 Tax=Corynebacterium lizhenjunii TaxID=2709394 RepID=A0A7T0PC16_9CORY|nr:RNA-binding S4 domain-containing protein [Corynebacterium lizhenjunii]QPK79242.1 RNA-binding S4 domain-containing protein [Corynebacterium lizhenjunii]
MLEVSIKGESIKLGQFVKLASLVATGGEAKELIAAGAVTVNGQPVTARGYGLSVGDEVCIGKQCARVAAADDDEDDYFDEATANDDFDPEKWRNL